MNLLAGQTAVVTGGAQGLGLAIAQAMQAAGARVVIGDLDAGTMERALDTLNEGGAAAMRCDVTKADQVDALLGFAVERFGSVDILVNNAGITRDASLRTMTEDQFDSVIGVHLKGCWNGIRAAAPLMRQQRRGAIINVSSLSGKVGNFGQTNYSAAKAGIVGLTKAAAKELATDGVRVNAIQPGLIDTQMTRAMPEHVWEQKVAEIPLGRAGQPAEVAAVTVFLASTMAAYMTGNVLEVAGGRFM
jgi:3-oxoacyl-[acyl-carrier protein] reductase